MDADLLPGLDGEDTRKKAVIASLYLLAGVLLLATAVYAAGVIPPDGAQNQDGEMTNQNDANEPVGSDEPEPQPHTDTHETNGEEEGGVELGGQEGSGSFETDESRELPAGLYLFQLEHDADDSFEFVVHEQHTGDSTTVIETQGRWSGESAVWLERGNYSAEITASADWRFNAAKASFESPDQHPSIEEDEDYSAVFGPFESEGYIYDLKIDVPDEEHLYVYTVDDEGETFDVVERQTGPVEIDTSYTLLPSHYLVVETESEGWEVELRSAMQR